MKFSYNWLQSFFQETLPPPQRLAELLTLYSFEVKKVERRGKDYLLDIDVLPNRVPDCGGHLGIAKEIGAILNLKVKLKDWKPKEDRSLQAKNFIKVQIKEKNACIRYVARVLTEIKVTSSPAWLRKRLELSGLQAINNIVDIANYVMLETGQPLHAFDGEKLEHNKIIVRWARKGEKITTLDEKTYTLDEDILVISDPHKPLAIAGIKGGKDAEINKKTKIVVLESANFQGRVIRKASKKLNLKTDASLRFEHNLDPNLAEFAINRAAFLIQKLTNGKVTQGLLDIYPKKVLPKKIKLDLEYTERLLGVKIPGTKVKKILKSLNFQCVQKKPRYMEVVVPTERQDISIVEDLIEEIGRIYGYEKIPTVFPQVIFLPPQRNERIFWRNFIRNCLKELGFIEVYNYSFISEKEVHFFSKSRNLLRLKNPISNAQSYLRPSLIPNLLKNVKENSKFPEFGEIKIFEVGKIFQKPFQEKEMIGGLIFQRERNEKGFYRLKGILDTLLNQMGISNIWYDDFKPIPEESPFSFWHKRRCAEIKLNYEKIGFLGEISQRVLKEYEIEGGVFLFDLDFEKLSQLACEEQEYQPFSPYPAAIRDIAILVPRKTKVVDVLNVINAVGGKVVRDIDLFDIYEGPELPAGKKNFAFHIMYQAEDHTLSSEEIEKIHNKIIHALEENLEWEVRK